VHNQNNLLLFGDEFLEDLAYGNGIVREGTDRRLFTDGAEGSGFTWIALRPEERSDSVVNFGWMPSTGNKNNCRFRGGRHS
jgi:hypothetical protein